MDAKCERRFPLYLPGQPRFHLVAVATGVREASARQLHGDGSLTIVSDSDGRQPFCIGDLDRSKDFVHVFDDTSLDAVLHELDERQLDVIVVVPPPDRFEWRALRDRIGRATRPFPASAS